MTINIQKGKYPHYLCILALSSQGALSSVLHVCKTYIMGCAHRFSMAINNQAFNRSERECQIYKHFSSGKVIISKLWKAVPCGNSLDISLGYLF